jgi:hypothetical protein
MVNLSRVLFSFILFIGISFAQDVVLTLDGGDLNYESSADIYGFQFNHEGCATGANGGDAAGAGFVVSGSPTTVLGFSFSGAFIPAGSGTLVSGVDCDTVTDLIFSGAGGSSLTAEMATSTETPCDDADADGVCDDEDDCIGSLDACGVCNGDNSSCADCAGVPNGDAALDDCGVCNGGNADQDCAGDCFGDAFVGCSGDCDSSVEDACGVCSGDGSSCDFSVNQSQVQAAYFIDSVTLGGASLDEGDLLVARFGGEVVGASSSLEDFVIQGRDLDIVVDGDVHVVCETTGTCGYPSDGDSVDLSVFDASTGAEYTPYIVSNDGTADVSVSGQTLVFSTGLNTDALLTVELLRAKRIVRAYCASRACRVSNPITRV